VKSAHASRVLAQNGFAAVWNLTSGLRAWPGPLEREDAAVVSRDAERTAP